jgi:hypothetical protein
MKLKIDIDDDKLRNIVKELVEDELEKISFDKKEKMKKIKLVLLNKKNNIFDLMFVNEKHKFLLVKTYGNVIDKDYEKTLIDYCKSMALFIGCEFSLEHFHDPYE